MRWLKYTGAISGLTFCLFGLFFIVAWLAGGAASDPRQFQWASLFFMVLPLIFVEVGWRQFRAGLQAGEIPVRSPGSAEDAGRVAGCFVVAQYAAQLVPVSLFLFVSCVGIPLMLFSTLRGLMSRPVTLDSPFLIQVGAVAGYFLLRWPAGWLIARIRA